MIQEYIKVIEEKTTLSVSSFLEIGSLNGHMSSAVSYKYDLSNDNLWLIEPNPYSADFIRKAYPGRNVIQKAIGETVGNQSKVPFNCVISNNMDHKGCSGVIERVDTFGKTLQYEKTIVDIVSGENLLSEIFDSGGPVRFDMCTIDVEGMALDVLKSFDSSISDLHSVAVEVETKDIFGTGPNALEVIKFMRSAGFDIIYQEYAYEGQQDIVFVQRKFLK